MTVTLDLILQSGLDRTLADNNNKEKFANSGMSSRDLSDTEQKQEDDYFPSAVAAAGGADTSVSGALLRIAATTNSNGSSNIAQDNVEQHTGSEGALQGLISRWCQSQDTETDASSQKPSNDAASTALLLLQMQKLENRVQKQENQIQSLQQCLLDQQSTIQSDLTRILNFVSCGSAEFSPFNESTNTFPMQNIDRSGGQFAANGSHPRTHQPQQPQPEFVVAPPSDATTEISVVNSHSVSRRSVLADCSSLHPSSVFTSVRTIERQPPKPPQRHDSLQSQDRPLLQTTVSGLSTTSGVSSASSNADKFVFHPPAKGPRFTRGSRGGLSSRNSMRNNKAQHLEIIWDASEHTTNNNKNKNIKLENGTPRPNINYDPKDLFKSDGSHGNQDDNVELDDSIITGATRAFISTTNGMHDSTLTGINSFMCDDGEEEPVQELKKNIKSEKRDRRLKTRSILWKRSERKESSPVIPKRVASMKRPIHGDLDRVDESSSIGSDNEKKDIADIEVEVQNNNNTHMEIPLNLTDSEIQVQHTGMDVSKNEMDISNNDVTVRTPLPQDPPTAPPPLTTRRFSDFHPPSPPPRHRKFFPRTRGMMPTLANSKREIYISGGSSRLQLSSLTLDTALPSSDSGAFLREVTNYPITDKCSERGTYTGTVNENDEPDGYGTMTYTSGAFYKGDWKDGHWHGHGILRSLNGDSYEGDFVYDCRHGRGIYKYENGDVYEGDFSSDKRHGKGTFLFQTGAMYRGDLAYGHFEGYGWYVFDEGNYEGEWLQGAYHGIGTLQYTDGSSYTGRFKAGVADGMGEERTATGTSRRGVWQNGELPDENQEEQGEQ